MENMFLQWLHESNVDLDAMIFTSQKDWCPPQYIFRFRVSGGEWSGPHFLTWGMDTFVLARGIIREALP
jgi:hypothetical protein